MADGELPVVRRTGKSESAFRTISEVAEVLEVPQHVLRFWESKFPQVRPLKRGGGRRYYRPEDVALLRRIRDWLYGEGYTIKGVQKLLREGSEQNDGPPRAGSEEEPTVISGAEPSSPAPDTAPPSLSEAEEEGGAAADGLSIREAGKSSPETRRQLTDILRELEQIHALLIAR